MAQHSTKEILELRALALLEHAAANFDFIRCGPGFDAISEKLHRRIKQMYKYVLDHHYQVSLKDLAQQFGINLFHMSHALKEQFGLSYQNLLNYSRGTHAAKLLLGTDNRIIDISNESGFSDQKYLIKYFKDNHGCTPTEFRAKHRISTSDLDAMLQYASYPLSTIYELVSSW